MEFCSLKLWFEFCNQISPGLKLTLQANVAKFHCVSSCFGVRGY